MESSPRSPRSSRELADGGSSRELAEIAELGIARLSLEDTPASVLPPRRPAFGHAGDEALAAEVYERMLERELEVRTWVPCGGYWSANGLLDRRDKVVDWLYGATEALNMDAFVLHLAVHYMDWTMLAVSVAAADMQLLAMVCAYAAAKFHGPEHVVPCLKLVQELARAEGPEGAEQVKAMELKVLFALEWRLNAVTALHIADHHLALGAIVPADECGAADRRQLATKLRQFTDFFLLQTLYDHRFLQSRASLRGAAAIAAARHTVGLQAWPTALQTRSGYGTREVCRVAQDILDYTQSRFPDQFEKVEARWSVLQTSSSDSECDESPPVSPLKAPGAEASAMDAVDSKGPAE